MIWTCGSCSTINQANATACAACGAQRATVLEPVPLPPSTSQRRWWPMALAAVVGALCIVAVVAVAMSRDKADTERASDENIGNRRSSETATPTTTSTTAPAAPTLAPNGGGSSGGDQNNDDEDSSEGDPNRDGGSARSLAGMKGTVPLVELSEEFKDRLLEVDPQLQDFNYGAESYDAVVVIALAAEQAKTDGIEYASEINGITREGEKCETFEACKAVIDGGGDVDYDGVSGPLEFSGNGEPTVASYGVLTFGEDNRIDDAATEYVTAQAPEEADVEEVPVEGEREGDGALKLGTLLPQTGSLAFLGPPEFAGVDLAVEEVNAAGGVLGQDVTVIDGDSGDTETDLANATVDRLLSQNVDAIIGAATTGVTKTVIDKITAAGVVQFSPANTSKELSSYADRGLYFRDAPSDILQGAMLSDLIAGDGNTTVGILNLDDPYGTGLAEDLTTALSEAGIAVVERITYDPAAQAFDAEVEQMASADPEAVVVIGFDESSRILAAMVEAGIGPADKAVYGCDGNMGNALGESFEAGS